jgi:hypothetical protein
MIWEEFERAGAIRAFRVILPEELQGQHWFEVQAVDGGTLVRHTVDGEASVSTRRSGATGSSPATTASWKPFSTTSRRPWPENSDRHERTRSLTTNGVGIRRRAGMGGC